MQEEELAKLSAQAEEAERHAASVLGVTGDGQGTSEQEVGWVAGTRDSRHSED